MERNFELLKIYGERERIKGPIEKIKERESY